MKDEEYTMYDLQTSQLVPARPEKQTMLLRYAALALVAFGLLTCVWVNPILWALPTIGFIWWWWRMWFHSDIEYDYMYLDGTLDFDKVIDKRKRKSLSSWKMDDVVVIAPAGDDSVKAAYGNKEVKYYDYSSRRPSHRDAYYEMVVQESSGMFCICFEPDDNLLDKISIKYGRKVKRR